MCVFVFLLKLFRGMCLFGLGCQEEGRSDKETNGGVRKAIKRPLFFSLRFLALYRKFIDPS